MLWPCYKGHGLLTTAYNSAFTLPAGQLRPRQRKHASSNFSKANHGKLEHKGIIAQRV